MATEPARKVMTRSAHTDLLPSAYALSQLCHPDHPSLTRKQFVMVQSRRRRRLVWLGFGAALGWFVWMLV